MIEDYKVVLVEQGTLFNRARQVSIHISKSKKLYALVFFRYLSLSDRHLDVCISPVAWVCASTGAKAAFVFPARGRSLLEWG